MWAKIVPSKTQKEKIKYGDVMRSNEARDEPKKVGEINKNRSAMRTWGLMLSFISFGWNDVLKYQYLGIELLQVRRSTSR